MDLQQLENDFTKHFGNGEAPRFYFSPGRVNLIGEHTDYNGGHVFPCALSLGTYGAARKRADGMIRLISGNMGPAVDLRADNIVFDPAHGWANTLKGVAFELIKAGNNIGGFELYIYGDLPHSAGLSSSASVELLTAAALNDLFELNINTLELVKLCQRAENQFIGVNCGILDQFACGMCRKNHAVLLDCGNLVYDYVPLKLGDYRIVIANTNTKRALADSKYNERRAECERALRDLKTALKKNLEPENLCDLDNETFDKNKYAIKNETARKRAEHAVYENTRALMAVDALKADDLRAFGRLMNESHISLRDLYEVTGSELDALAEAAWAVEGALGSRMTGAGFGGCTVSIVRKNAIDTFIETVGASYSARTGITADFYIAETGGGAGRIEPPARGV